MHRARSALILAAAILFAAPAAAHDYKVSDLTILHPWARATAPRAPSGGVFLVIENNADEMERLLSVSTPTAGQADIHNTINDDGVMRMRPVDILEVPGHDQAELAPGGLHIMLIGLEERLAEGSRFPLTLHFEKAGDVEIEVAVQSAGAAGPDTAAADGDDATAAPTHNHGQ